MGNGGLLHWFSATDLQHTAMNATVLTYTLLRGPLVCALTVLACIVLVTGCKTTSEPMILHSKERLKISADMSFYVSRGEWETPITTFLAHPKLPASLAQLVEQRLQSEGLVVAQSIDKADYVLVFSVVMEAGSPLFPSKQSIETVEMLVIERSSNTVVIGSSKNCCINVNDYAAQTAGFLRSIVKERGVFLSTLAQSPVTDDPCKDANEQFDLDLDQKSWGAIYPEQIVAPKVEDPSATALVGKNLTYLTSYLDCYHREVKSMKIRRGLYGCIGGLIVVAIVNPYTIYWLASP